MNRVHFVQTAAQSRQLKLEVLVVRRDDVLRKFVQRRDLPVAILRAGRRPALNFFDYGLRLEALGEARLVKRLPSAAAVIEAMTLQGAYGG
jgi:hypothetical protein